MEDTNVHYWITVERIFKYLKGFTTFKIFCIQSMDVDFMKIIQDTHTPTGQLMFKNLCFLEG